MSMTNPTCACCVNHPVNWNTPWYRYPYSQSLSEDLKISVTTSPKYNGLSEEEKEILALSSELWQRFVDLPESLDDEVKEFQLAVHNLQRIIATRVARRVNPDVWRNV